MKTTEALPHRVASLIRRTVTSIWALEMLLFLKQNAERAWGRDEIVRHLRASYLLVAENLDQLCRGGLVIEDPQGQFQYRPVGSALAQDVDLLELYSCRRPLAVRDAILAAPNDKVQLFADAFRLKRT